MRNRLIALLVLFTVSCSSEDKEFDNVALPMSAQQFVKQYFADASYSRVEKEKDNGFWEYEVLLSDGSKVEFNEKADTIGRVSRYLADTLDTAVVTSLRLTEP